MRCGSKVTFDETCGNLPPNLLEKLPESRPPTRLMGLTLLASACILILNDLTSVRAFEEKEKRDKFQYFAHQQCINVSGM